MNLSIHFPPTLQDSDLAQVEEKKEEKEEKEGWFKAYVKTIIGNIQVSLSNVHIRYEDATSSPGHPFATGVFLGKLSVKTVDEEGNETFVKSGALQLIRKVKKRQAVYMHTHTHTQTPIYLCVRVCMCMEASMTKVLMGKNGRQCYRKSPLATWVPTTIQIAHFGL